MKSKPHKILKSVLLSAVASMFGTSANAEDVMMPVGGSDENGFKELESSSSRVYKNVLKMNPSGNVVPVDSHRSHSSHSSHRSGSYVRSHSSHTSHTSHSSSSSSYGIYTPSRSTRTNTKTRKTTPGTSSSSSRSTGYGTGTSSSSSRTSGTVSGIYTAPTTKTIDQNTIKMGDRTMSLNLYGNDINELVKLLAEKLYIRDSWVSKMDGFMLYDSAVEEAVKHFQKDAGMTQTGKMDSSAIQILKTWDSEKTTAILGVRDLYVVESLPMAGTDVDELVTLLWAKGLTPPPSTVEKRNGHAVYSLDISLAVKLYQKYNNMVETGRVDEAFVKSIKGNSK